LVGPVRLADLGQRLWIAKDVDRLFQLSKVLRADENGRGMSQGTLASPVVPGTIGGISG